MRILAITSLYPRPGHEAFAAFNRQQFRALAAENELRVIAPVAWTEECRDRWKGRRIPRPGHNPDGIWVTHPRYYFPPKILADRYGECYLASIRAAATRLLEEFAPDVLLSCSGPSRRMGHGELARQAGLPAVIKVIGTDVLVLPRHPRRRTRVVEGLSLADRVVAVSRDLADQVIRLGVDPLKVAVVSEGVNTNLFPARGAGRGPGEPGKRRRDAVDLVCWQPPVEQGGRRADRGVPPPGRSRGTIPLRPGGSGPRRASTAR